MLKKELRKSAVSQVCVLGRRGKYANIETIKSNEDYKKLNILVEIKLNPSHIIIDFH